MFLVPSLLHLIFFIFTPIAFAAYLSTHRWDLIVADRPFIGLDNFREMAANPDSWEKKWSTDERQTGGRVQTENGEVKLEDVPEEEAGNVNAHRLIMNPA